MTGIEVAVGTAMLNAGVSFATASAIITALPQIALAAAAIATSASMANRRRRALGSGRSVINDDRGLQQRLPETAPYWLRAYGIATTSGKEFWKAGGIEIRPHYYLGVLLAAHECNGLVAVHLGPHRVLIDPVTGLATSTPFNDGQTSYIEVSYRNGSIDQEIDPIIARDFPDVEPTFRQRGHCTAVIKATWPDGADYQEREDNRKALFGDGVLNPVFEFQGASVYDPRSPVQALADPATWQWTRNAVLNAVDGLIWFNERNRERIDWGRVAEEAEIADWFVATKAGERIRQYTLDGALSDDQDVEDALLAMLTACGGSLMLNATKFYVLPGRRKKPVFTLHEGNARGPVEYQPAPGYGETVNIVKGEFFSPEKNLKTVPAPVIRNEAAIAEEGIERPISPRAPFTRRHERAQRLFTRIAKEARVVGRAWVGADISAFAVEAGETIRLDRAGIHPALTGEWEVETIGFDESTGEHRMALERYDDTVNDFDPQTEELTFTGAAA